MTGACVLVSGGIESSVLLSEVLGRFDAVIPIYVQAGLRWEDAEKFSLKRFLRHLKSSNLKPFSILDLPMRDLYEGHWSVTGLRVPGADSKDEAVYLPGRNVILLSKAACFAALHGISSIEIGVLKGNPFSDSTPAFFKKMSEALSSGLNKEIHIEAPFLKLKKEDVILRGKKLPLELTFSCIHPKGYDHCGECNKCTERKKAFFGAGIPDKTNYRKEGI